MTTADHEHGYSAYSRGARDPECREAKRVYQAQLRDENQAVMAAYPGIVAAFKHGTSSRYNNDRCRCAECRLWRSDKSHREAAAKRIARVAS